VNKDADKAYKFQAASMLLMLVMMPFILLFNIIIYPFTFIADKIRGRKSE
jgi:hypothetical protein